jgi:hypothetical protein
MPRWQGPTYLNITSKSLRSRTSLLFRQAHFYELCTVQVKKKVSKRKTATNHMLTSDCRLHVYCDWIRGGGRRKTEWNIWSWPPLQVGLLSQLAKTLEHRQIPMILYIHYSMTWPPVYLESRPQLICLICTFNLPMSADLKGCRVLVHAVHEHKCSFISRTTSCPINLHPFPQVWAKDWKFLVATDTVLQVSNHWQVYVPASKLDSLSLHCVMNIRPSDSCVIKFS